jgi:hypothetical protein
VAFVGGLLSRRGQEDFWGGGGGGGVRRADPEAMYNLYLVLTTAL